MRITALVATAIVLAISSAQGQNLKRPKLPGDKDPNNWEAYYDEAIARIWRDPSGAEAMFVYASHLRPDRAEPLYARYISFHSRDQDRFVNYILEDEKTLKRPDVIAADSLRIRAFQRNPFVHEGLLMFLYDRLPGKFRDDSRTRAWIYMGNGDLPKALELFGQLVKREPERYGYLRFVRASAFVNSGRPDSALAELTARLDQLHTQDDKLSPRAYQSKELLEYARGLILMRRRSAAKDAFGSAIVENASFAPAHMMLAQIAGVEKDTATALSELQLALATDSTDVELHVAMGKALRQANRPADAAAEFRKAVALEPLYALPHYQLAAALEAAGDNAGASESYRRFISLAPWDDELRTAAQQKVQTLKP